MCLCCVVCPFVRREMQWEEEEIEKKEIYQFIWNKFSLWCQHSNNPPIILTKDGLKIDQICMKTGGCHFRTNFIMGLKRDEGFIINTTYGPSEFLISSSPQSQLNKYSFALGRFIDFGTIECLRFLYHFLSDASVSYSYLCF